jgi:hypothetical protein
MTISDFESGYLAGRVEQQVIIDDQAKQIDTLRKALNKIANLDPEFDSDEGFNEWGEADCFIQAQKIAIAAAAPQPKRTEMTELTVTRKDLQDAAKAAGVKLNPFGVKDGTKQGDERLIGFMTDPTVWKGGWFNPEHDPGESFELAFRLRMCVNFEEALVMMPSGDSINFELGNIKEACKAIVLAAAEIGRAKE